MTKPEHSAFATLSHIRPASEPSLRADLTQLVAAERFAFASYQRAAKNAMHADQDRAAANEHTATRHQEWVAALQSLAACVRIRLLGMAPGL